MGFSCEQPLGLEAIEVVSQNGNEQHILLILADGASRPQQNR